MTREFTRNMFIMLVAIMVGVIVITFFSADIIRRTEVETLNIEHQTTIQTINTRNENFTNNFFQGIVEMDAAREDRETGNYHFDFALFWYTNAKANLSDVLIDDCIENCTAAMQFYLKSYQGFEASKPYFIMAQQFTNESKYLEVLGYYVLFAQSGKNISMLRYNASMYLKYIAENLSAGNLANMSELLELFNETEALYNNEIGAYNDYRGQIDEYWFFDEIREPH